MSDALALITTEVPEITLKLTGDDVLAIRDKLKFYEEGLKAIRSAVDQATIDWIKVHGDLNAGNGVRYYVGAEKKVKCNDVPAAIEALMQATDGDYTAFCATLSANAIKQSVAAEMLDPVVFHKLFTTTYSDDLREGNPEKAPKLKKFDPKFM